MHNKITLKFKERHLSAQFLDVYENMLFDFLGLILFPD